MACLQQLDCQDTTPSPPTTNRRSWNISPMLDLSPSLSTPVAGELMVVESTRAAPTPPTLPWTTPSSWSDTEQMPLMETSGSWGTVGEQDGARMVSSDWGEMPRPSVELIHPPWTEPPVLMVLDLTNNTCADSVESSSTLPTHLEPTPGLCLELI